MGTGTGIGRVRGLGSARHGALHWWRQRLTAGSNLVLVTWLVVSLFRLPVLDHKSVVQWLSSPWNAVLMLLVTGSVFYHFRLGLQTVIEDYQREGSRFVALILLNFYTVALAAIAIFSILKIAFGAAA